MKSQCHQQKVSTISTISWVFTTSHTIENMIEYPERQKFIGKFFHLPDNVKYKAGFFLMVSESTSNSSLKKLKISKSKERMF